MPPIDVAPQTRLSQRRAEANPYHSPATQAVESSSRNVPDWLEPEHRSLGRSDSAHVAER